MLLHPLTRFEHFRILENFKIGLAPKMDGEITPGVENMYLSLQNFTTGIKCALSGAIVQLRVDRSVFFVERSMMNMQSFTMSWKFATPGGHFHLFCGTLQVEHGSLHKIIQA